MTPMEQKLVEALRSGRWEQADGQLRFGDKYCCLGVACAISGVGEFGNGLSIDRDTFVTTDMQDRRETASAILPERVKKLLGWSADTGLVTIRDRSGRKPTLTELNDEGFTFAQIADIIAAGFVETYADWVANYEPPQEPKQGDE
jgi:hypothetical protein